MIKFSAWNIHGITEWKDDHPDLLNLLNSNDITCIVEFWFSETQCELIKKNKLIDKFSILYTCRKKSNRAKRNSGGIIFFIKKCLNKHVSIVQQLDEDILWLRLSKLVTNNERDLYLYCTYVSPRFHFHLICRCKSIQFKTCLQTLQISMRYRLKTMGYEMEIIQ